MLAFLGGLAADIAEPQGEEGDLAAVIGGGRKKDGACVGQDGCVGAWIKGWGGKLGWGGQSAIITPRGQPTMHILAFNEVNKTIAGSLGVGWAPYECTK